jgi:hypothetical protein
MAIGIMGGGILITKFKPKARPLVVYMFIVEMIANMSIFTVMFLGCPTPNFAGTSIVGGRFDNVLCDSIILIIIRNSIVCFSIQQICVIMDVIVRHESINQFVPLTGFQHIFLPVLLVVKQLTGLKVLLYD